MRSRQLLAEDHELVRSGIRSLLTSSPEIDVVGEANDGHEALAMVRELKPDLVLMDVAMNNLNGIDAARQIVAENPQVGVLMLSMHGDQQYVFEALKAGAKGYILKSAAVKDLLAGIRAVAEGKTYISPSLSSIVMEDYARRAKGEKVAGEADRLTGREREVLQLIAEGRSSAEIAKLLHIGTRTVETHRYNVMQKLEIRSTAALTKFAIRNGLCAL